MSSARAITAFFVLSAVLHGVAAASLAPGDTRTAVATTAVLAGLAGLVPRARRLGLAAAIAGLTALYLDWQPATWPAVDWLRGTGIGLKLAGRSVDVLGLGWAAGALIAVTAVCTRSWGLRVIAMVVLSTSLVLPQGAWSDSLVSADDAVPVRVVEDGEVVERGWLREQVAATPPVARLPDAMASERALAAVSRGASMGWTGAVRSVAGGAACLFLYLRVLLALVLLVPAHRPLLVTGIVAFAPAATLLLSAVSMDPRGLVPAIGGLLAVGAAALGRRP